MSDWSSAVDPKTGRTYYVNFSTKETRWEKPDGGGGESEAREGNGRRLKCAACMHHRTVVPPNPEPPYGNPSPQNTPGERLLNKTDEETHTEAIPMSKTSNKSTVRTCEIRQDTSSQELQ